MKHFTFDNQWNEIKGKLKQRFAQLTDDDLIFVEGKAEELLARLREKLGLSSQDLNALLLELRGKAADLAENVKGQASATYEQTRARARGFFGDGEDYVRRNPRESIVATLCAGFVAGLLIRH